MAFCVKCGAKIQDGANFCTVCGTATEAGWQQPAGQTPPNYYSGAQPQTPPNYYSGAQPQTPPSYSGAQPQTPPFYNGAPPHDGVQGVSDNSRTMAILAYILFFVPLLAGAHKESPFVKFHTNQGTVLFICAAAYGVVRAIISAIIYAISWRLWPLSAFLGWISVVFLVFCVLGIVNVVNGKTVPLPVIGGISIIK